jgi:multidrug efflux pump
MSPWAALLRQPVLVVLMAAALGIFGLAAVLTLPLRASPIIPTRLVDISTNYNGTDAETMDKFVTLPLESSITSLAGVKYVTGTTSAGTSDIQAFLDDDADPDTVFAEVLAAVNADRGNLPPAMLPPNVSLVGDDNANQELNAVMTFPPSASEAEVTAFFKSGVIPRLETIPGIGPLNIYTDTPAVRIHMDPLRLQALGLTPDDVAQSVANASAVDSGGILRSGATAMQVNMRPGLTTAAAFDTLPIATHDGVSLPLRSVASADIGFSAGSGEAFWDRRPCVWAAAGIAPAGNILEVAKNFAKMIKSIQPTLPPGVALEDVYDESISVRKSLHDLGLTLLITILLVGLIVRLSLGTMRAAAAPFLAILLSLLGAAIVMQITQQTLNLFTIIALVLAVGLVVDDAIVVVEDVFRRVQEGETPIAAATASATRLAPVLAAISSTLVVAFLPLGFLSGLTSALFRPFALVLISAFLLSLLIALTIVPSMAMWASKTYRHRDRLAVLDRLRNLYARLLAPTLRFSPLTAGIVLAVAFCCLFLLQLAPKNLVPAADGLFIDIYATVPDGASKDYVMAQTAVIENTIHKLLPGLPDWMVGVESQHAIFGGYGFDTPAEAKAAVQLLTPALSALPGVSAYVSQENGMPGTEDLPVSVVVSGQTDAARLLNLATTMQNQAYASGKFNYLNITPGNPQYQYTVAINRPLAAALGISDTDIGGAIADSLSNGTLGQVNVQGTTMNLVTQLPSNSGTDMLKSIPVRTASGALVPLGTIITLAARELPDALGSWQGLPSVNITGQQVVGVSLSAALDQLKSEFHALPTRDLSFGYSGPSEIFQDSQTQNARLFGFGLLGLFFLLAAQFRSFRDPFVVITTVPLASLGPLLLCICGGATLNIVTEISLLTVWGLIARQGILFVQVAHEGRALKMPIREAALRAAKLRFRPILMITLALIGGAIPLILASGPQAVIRYDLGAVLATGMGSGFLLSLFAVPAMYCLLHRTSHEVH